MKKSGLIAVLLTLGICFSGCYQNEPMYEQEDADKIAAQGSEMMQEWLDDNMPDAKLEECKAHIAWTRYDGNNYLTDYASGTISLDDEQKVFTIHTKTGAVYFEMDADTKQKFTEIAESYFYEAIETIGIVPESTAEGYVFECSVMAPAEDGDSAREVPYMYYYDFGLPAGTEDLEEFVRSPKSRLPIYVSVPDMNVSDTTDLSIYDHAAMEALEAEYGVFIGSMRAVNSDQHWQKSVKYGEQHTELWEYGYWLETNEFRLRGIVYKRNELQNPETNELTVSEQKLNPETDLAFEKTDYGYCLSLMNKDLYDRLSVQAYEGAEMLKYDYYCLDEEEYSSQKEIPENADETAWKKLKDGSYVLTDSSSGSTLWLYDGDILVRKK